MDKQQRKALLDAAWKRVKTERPSEDKPFGGDEPTDIIVVDNPHWSYRLTSPLPAVWPPPENLTLYYYAYATGFDLTGGLQDGVYVASPWARIEVMPKSDSLPKLTWLSDTLVEVGIQGVRPLSEAETSLFEMWSEERVVNFLTQFHTTRRANKTDTLEIKKFFCMTMSHMGTIYEALRSRHEAFYRWLGCKNEFL